MHFRHFSREFSIMLCCTFPYPLNANNPYRNSALISPHVYVLLCFIKLILGNRYVRYWGFIVSEPMETLLHLETHSIYPLIQGVACIRDVGCAHPGFALYFARIRCQNLPASVTVKMAFLVARIVAQ